MPIWISQSKNKTQKKSRYVTDYVKVTFQEELKKEKQMTEQLRIFKQYKVKRAVKRNAIAYLTKLHAVFADLFNC